MTEDGTWPKHYTNVTYSDESSLNTLDVCLPRRPSADDARRFWVVYIHGGAWRDPAIDASSFKIIRTTLLGWPVNEQIAGYASINYRLSPYPSHPIDPSDPSDPARNAKHPDHIRDVLAAILYLQEQYDLHDRYVLVGHSCGATLAFQVAMKRYWGMQYESTFALEMKVEPPIAVVGLEGIYDIPALVQNHKDHPVYEDIILNAFGQHNWDTGSPTSGKYDDSWLGGRIAVLAHSPEDTLVEHEQVELMRRTLSTPISNIKTILYELKGEHDEVWQTGEAAKAIRAAVEELMNLR